MLRNVLSKGNNSAIYAQTDAEYEGHSFIDIRQWFKNSNGEWSRTKKGFAVPQDPEKLRELGESLVKLADDMGKAK